MQMIRKLLFLPLFSLSAYAQSVDPAVMVINGQPITRSAFEYAFNKNRSQEPATQQEIEEYAQRFIDYKLKVLAAREARLDTLSSFKQEFQSYRDQLLSHEMVDQAFIDSVAISLYERMVKQVGEKGLYKASHILLAVPQQAPEAEAKRIFLKADSISQALKSGADFATLAKEFSQDSGSANQGGELPWFGPGETLPEFENVVYSLKSGETSAPFLSPAGYHIVRLLERKPLESYETLKPQIMASLQRQNIEEYSASQRIKRIVAASNGRLTREQVLDSVYQANLHKPEITFLIQEYEDGLLLYEMSNRNVWQKAGSDTKALEATFQKNKSKYTWATPHFKGYVYMTKNKSLEKSAKRFIKEQTSKENWRQLLKSQFNKDSVQVAIVGPLLVKAGENTYVDKYVFNKSTVLPASAFPYSGVVGKKLSQPKSFEDVRERVVADYQQKLENDWVQALRSKYTYTIDTSVLRTVNQHWTNKPAGTSCNSIFYAVAFNK